MSNAIVKAVSLKTNKFGFILKKYSPEIMTATGIACGIVGTVFACKATIKAQDILAESKETIDTIHGIADGTLPKKEGTDYTEEDNRKDLAAAYIQTGVKLVKVYAPAIGFGAASIACILGGHKILRGRNVALAAAYATIDQAFKDYRGRVVSKLGQAADQEFRYNLKAEKISDTVVDEETGKEKKIKKTVLVPASDDGVYSGYARLFGPGCQGWENNASLNRAFLKAQEDYANDKLRAQGYLFLSDVYKALGFRDDRASHAVGWVLDEENPQGDNYVSFGFRNNDLFMSGYEPSVILDFNVDGPILDTFEAAYRGSAVC